MYRGYRLRASTTAIAQDLVEEQHADGNNSNNIGHHNDYDYCRYL